MDKSAQQPETKRFEQERFEQERFEQERNNTLKMDARIKRIRLWSMNREAPATNDKERLRDAIRSGNPENVRALLNDPNIVEILAEGKRIDIPEGDLRYSLPREFRKVDALELELIEGGDIDIIRLLLDAGAKLPLDEVEEVRFNNLIKYLFGANEFQMKKHLQHNSVTAILDEARAERGRVRVPPPEAYDFVPPESPRKSKSKETRSKREETRSKSPSKETRSKSKETRSKREETRSKSKETRRKSPSKETRRAQIREGRIARLLNAQKKVRTGVLSKKEYKALMASDALWTRAQLNLGGGKRKSYKRKSYKRKSYKRKSYKRKSYKRKSYKRKSYSTNPSNLSK